MRCGGVAQVDGGAFFPTPAPRGEGRGEGSGRVPLPGDQGRLCRPGYLFNEVSCSLGARGGQPLHVCPTSKGFFPPPPPRELLPSPPGRRRCPSEIFAGKANLASHLSLARSLSLSLFSLRFSLPLSAVTPCWGFQSVRLWPPFIKAISLRRCLKWLLISLSH